MFWSTIGGPQMSPYTYVLPFYCSLLPSSQKVLILNPAVCNDLKLFSCDVSYLLYPFYLKNKTSISIALNSYVQTNQEGVAFTGV